MTDKHMRSKDIKYLTQIGSDKKIDKEKQPYTRIYSFGYFPGVKL